MPQVADLVPFAGPALRGELDTNIKIGDMEA
jgi:hypothetical protein